MFGTISAFAFGHREVKETCVENRVTRRIFGPRRDEVAEKQGDMYSPSKFFWVIKSRKMGSLGYVAPMGRREVYKWFW